ncbi:MAG: DinB family protein [Dehalococcoidia bacterium]|nr:DinB family protein [Dehalococcoidia bacterium]MCB9486127.1 DinB family protein [Thermoflexaceae bacterium]
MADLSEEQIRIRSYLQGQAARLSLADLVAKVLADSGQLRSAAESAEAVDITARPAEGEWSVNEVLNHVRDSCQSVNAGMLAAAFEGRHPAPVRDSIVPTRDVRRPLEWFAAIDSERKATFERLAALAGDEHLDIAWEHPFFGPLNWREWLLFTRIHDIDHARQLESIVAALKG